MEKEMIIKVFSRKEIEKFLTDMPHIVISARDPESKEVKLPDNPNRIAELHLEFDDCDGFSLLPTLERFKPFSSEDAKSILKLVNLTYPYVNMILVNCEAGISRSAGIAAALSILLGRGDQIYFNIKGPYYPNKFVYKTLLTIAEEENFNVPKD